MLVKFLKLGQKQKLTLNARNVILYNRKYSSTYNAPDKELIKEKFCFPNKTYNIKDLDESLLGKQVTIQGFIDKPPRKQGDGIIISSIRDSYFKTFKIVEDSNKNLNKLKKLKIETPISITGIISKNNHSLELIIEDLRILNKPSLETIELTSGKSTKNWKPEDRYLQIRTDKSLHDAIHKRALALNSCRNALEKYNFTEIETPLLFRSSPEGAKEFIVPLRGNKHLFYSLPQSPQQYKQLLMASGIGKYYQVARCFRDEDLRNDRQPEFTQIDMEMSFANDKDVQEVVESLITYIWKDILNYIVPTRFEKLKYIDVMRRYGSDKPDMRYRFLQFINLTNLLPASLFKPLNNDFPDFDIIILKQGMILDSNYESHLNEALARKYYKARKPAFALIKENNDLYKWLNAMKPYLQTNDQSNNLKLLHQNINTKLDIEVGDIIIGCDRQSFPFEVPTPLGKCREVILKESLFPTTLETMSQLQNGNPPFTFNWIEQFPLLSPTETGMKKIEVPSLNSNSNENLTSTVAYPIFDYAKPESTHHPFTMVNFEDYEKLANGPRVDDKGNNSNPRWDMENIRALHYDLVINGNEVGGGSVRIHDSALQRYMLKTVLEVKHMEDMGIDNPFNHLLRALDSGCPPHAGLAIGFDRLLTILLGFNSIRNVIAFPKTKNGSDPLVNAPNVLTDSQIEQYNLKFIK